jgi:hypothetical protein
MATLHHLEARQRPPGGHLPGARFTRAELSQMLSIYSRRVADGEWRDYAIDNRDGMAVFSIFRHSFEPPLFAIVKRPAAAETLAEYALFSGPERLDSNRSLASLLTALQSRPRLVQG